METAETRPTARRSQGSGRGAPADERFAGQYDLLTAALIGAALFHRFGVPAGALLGAMLGVAGLNVAGREAVALPGTLQFLAFAALGWSIGAGVTRETVTTLQHSLLPLTVVVASLLIFGSLVAFLVAAAGRWARNGRRPVPAGLPGIRAWQLRRGQATLRWLERRGLSR